MGWWWWRKKMHLFSTPLPPPRYAKFPMHLNLFMTKSIAEQYSLLWSWLRPVNPAVTAGEARFQRSGKHLERKGGGKVAPLGEVLKLVASSLRAPSWLALGILSLATS